MRKKMLKILSVLLVFVLLTACVGLVSDFLVTRKSEKYISEKYSDTDYIVEEATYDFKTGNYYVHIKSPSSPDSSFTVYSDVFGRIGYDTYEDAVLKKWNTAGRIDDDYREAVGKVLESGRIPFEIDFGFGEIVYRESDTAEYGTVPDYAISTQELVIDGEYDISDMGKRAGKLTVYFYDSTVTGERLAEILLAVRAAADDTGVCFKAIDCILQQSVSDEDELANSGRVAVYGFMYDEIYRQGLVDRVKESME